MGLISKLRGKVHVGGLIVDAGTVTESGGAGTLNKMSGIITTASLTTAAGSTYTITLTDNKIAAADIVLSSVQLGTDTDGMPIVTRITPAAGSCVFILQNIHASGALNGTLKVAFAVLKAA